jgi:xylulokinase
MGAGMFRDWSEIERFLTVDRTVEPHPTAHGRYDELYRLYRELYPALRPIFHAEGEWAEAVAA